VSLVVEDLQWLKIFDLPREAYLGEELQLSRPRRKPPVAVASLPMVPSIPFADPYNLQRFVGAQQEDYEDVCAELRAGRKRTHWMWYIFPQMKGLGHSATAERFAISSLDEAQAYLQHPVLGRRLRECTQLVTLVDGRSLHEIFGSPDDLKFRSSMTLFARATAENREFLDALQKYSSGEFDPATLALLKKPQP
jgi:uncharacterized protein (DUF1810 family)